jgi:hypothetical protein
VQTGVSSSTAPTFTVPSAVKFEDYSPMLPATASDTTLYCYDEFDRQQIATGAMTASAMSYDRDSGNAPLAV